jgi:putative ABC transport system substrate-binding protein
MAMRRRAFIAALGGAVAWPMVARGQQQPLPVIGYLSVQSSNPPLVTVPFFLQGLGEAGFVDGRNVAIDFRYGENQLDRLPRLAAELVARQVAVIMATGAAALAAKDATSSIPIVFVIGDDPVKLGLVTSFGRREGNATGFNLMLNELAGKRLGLLRELVLNIRLFGILLNPNSPEAAIEAREVQALASHLGLEAIVLDARNENDVDAAFQILGQRQASAVIIVPDPWVRTRRFQLTELAGQRKLPTIYPLRDFVESGGLISYGPNLTDAYRQAGLYAGRILKGEKPGDLAVIQPTKFELVINLKTARALGLEIPPQLLARADEVIE